VAATAGEREIEGLHGKGDHEGTRDTKTGGIMPLFVSSWSP
jgi:hypothetical protein